jgi:hypothetical protein
MTTPTDNTCNHRLKGEPEGYVQWHEWAEKKNKTHYQVKCDKCGLYAIWKRRPDDTPTDNIEWLDKVLSDIPAKYVLQGDSLALNGQHEQKYAQAKQAIQAYIDTVCREARRNELELFAQDMNTIRVDDGFTPIEYTYIRKRLAELAAQTPPLNPNKDTGL